MAVSTDELRTVYTARDRGAVAAAKKIADADDRIDAAARRALRSQAQLMRVKAQYNNAFVASGRASARLSAFQGGGGGGRGRAAAASGGGGILASLFGKGGFGGAVGGDIGSSISNIGSKIAGLFNPITLLATVATGAFDAIKAGLRIAVDLAQKLGIGVLAGAAAFTAFTAATVNQAMAFDSLRRGLDAIAGSAAEGGKQWERLRALAKLPGIGFEEAVAGSLGLQSAKVSAGGSEKIMAALSRVNRGGAENFGAVMEQVVQIAGRKALSQQDVGIISARLPMFRSAIKDAFGTTDSKSINAMGMTPEVLLSKIADSLNKGPGAGGGGIQNAFDNIKDSWKFLLDSMGRAWFPFITTVLNTVAPFIEFLSSSGIAAGVANGFITALQGVVGNGGGIIGFFALFVAIMEQMPSILMKVGTFIGRLVTGLSAAFVTLYNILAPTMVSLINTAGSLFVGFANTVGGTMKTLSGFLVGLFKLAAALTPVFNPGQRAFFNASAGIAGELGNFQALPAFKPFAVPGKIAAPGDAVGGLMGTLGLGEDATAIGARQKEIMAQFGSWKAKQGAAAGGIGGAGGEPTSPAERAQIETAKNTGVTATATRKLADLNRGALGGGELGKLGITAVSLSSFLKGRGEAPVVVNASHPGLKSFLEDIAEQVLSSRRRAEAF